MPNVCWVTDVRSFKQVMKQKEGADKTIVRLEEIAKDFHAYNQSMVKLNRQLEFELEIVHVATAQMQQEDKGASDNDEDGEDIASSATNPSDIPSFTMSSVVSCNNCESSSRCAKNEILHSPPLSDWHCRNWLYVQIFFNVLQNAEVFVDVA